MAIWRSVDVFPNGGFADEPWLPNEDDDAFVRSAQRVANAYSEVLPDLQLQLPVSHVRLFVLPDPSGRRPRETTVQIDELHKDEFQSGRVRLARRYGVSRRTRAGFWRST